MFWHSLYQLLAFLLDMVRIVRQPLDQKDLEILFLRQQLAVVRRRQKRAPGATSCTVSSTIFAASLSFPVRIWFSHPTRDGLCDPVGGSTRHDAALRCVASVVLYKEAKTRSRPSPPSLLPSGFVNGVNGSGSEEIQRSTNSRDILPFLSE